MLTIDIQNLMGRLNIVRGRVFEAEGIFSGFFKKKISTQDYEQFHNVQSELNLLRNSSHRNHIFWV